MFKLFRVPLLVTVLAIVLTFVFGGITAAITVVILGVLEMSFSFDNAIVNAKILRRMDAHWQKLFLTVGILIAVFGMRLIFPLIVVAIAAHINPFAALALAVTSPTVYAEHIVGAHPAIAAFGGMFLLMLFLDWLFEEKEILWLAPLENQLLKLGKIENMSVIFALAVLAIGAMTLGHAEMVLLSGVFGLVTYLLVNSVDAFFNEEKVVAVAKAGLATFLYLEVLDASFSFDGVVGAFAVTNNIFLIAVGLGIGAMYIRGLTVYLTNKGTLNEYRYLEHGAHWAIGVLAIMLFVTIRFEISDIIIGLVGVGFIALAFANSVSENKKETLYGGDKRRGPQSGRNQPGERPELLRENR